MLLLDKRKDQGSQRMVIWSGSSLMGFRVWELPEIKWNYAHDFPPFVWSFTTCDSQDPLYLSRIMLETLGRFMLCHSWWVDWRHKGQFLTVDAGDPICESAVRTQWVSVYILMFALYGRKGGISGSTLETSHSFWVGDDPGKNHYSNWSCEHNVGPPHLFDNDQNKDRKARRKEEKGTLSALFWWKSTWEFRILFPCTPQTWNSMMVLTIYPYINLSWNHFWHSRLNTKY